MVKVLIVGTINDASLIGLAQKLENPEIHYLLVGAGDAAQLGKYGVSKAYVLPSQVDEHSFAELLVDLVNKNAYSLVTAPINKFFKTAIPIAAQRLSVPLVIDIVDLKQVGNTFEVVFNGVGNRAQITAKITDRAFVMAPPARFKAGEKPATTSTEVLQPKIISPVKIVSTEEKPKGKVRIEDADSRSRRI